MPVLILTGVTMGRKNRVSKSGSKDLGLSSNSGCLLLASKPLATASRPGDPPSSCRGPSPPSAIPALCHRRVYKYAWHWPYEETPVRPRSLSPALPLSTVEAVGGTSVSAQLSERVEHLEMFCPPLVLLSQTSAWNRSANLAPVYMVL